MFWEGQTDYLLLNSYLPVMHKIDVIRTENKI